MDMEDQYGISDLRHFISRATVGSVAQFPPFPAQQPSLPSSSEFFSAHHHPIINTAAVATPQQQQYEMVVMGRSMSDMLHHHNNNTTTNNGGYHHYHKEHNQHHSHFNSDSTTTTATANISGGFDGGDGGAARWPRQETLTLLEIRSRLDHKFKEANQKGPLWDEVARIMSEEHGYQRSGKKCREKFENLYKYYKKTKEGKAGRQDGKNYRFFRQLEALYGDNNSHHNNHSTSEGHHIAANLNAPHYNTNQANIIPSNLVTSDTHPILGHPTSTVSLSNSSDYETSSSDNDVEGSIESGDSKKKKRGKRSWKAKVKEFIDYQMKKIMEKQEAWLEKMMKTLDNRERERMEREQEWRKQETQRMEREHKFWASERAWIEARDLALMTALEKLTNTRGENDIADHSHCRLGIHASDQWLETEVTRLIQLRTSMESRFQQCGFSEEVVWEDIAAKMAYLGYDRTAIVCKQKWDSLNNYFQGKDDGSKKRKENYGEVSNNNTNNNNNNNTNNNTNHNHQGGLQMNHMGGFSNNCEINEPRLQLNEESSPSSYNSNVNVSSSTTVGVSGSVMNDSCLRFFLGRDSTNCGMKLNKAGNHSS